MAGSKIVYLTGFLNVWQIQVDTIPSDLIFIMLYLTRPMNTKKSIWLSQLYILETFFFQFALISKVQLICVYMNRFYICNRKRSGSPFSNRFYDLLKILAQIDTTFLLILWCKNTVFSHCLSILDPSSTKPIFHCYQDSE